MDLSLASYNVRNGRAFDGKHSWPFRKNRVVSNISDVSADVVGLQEVYKFQVKFLKAKLSQYSFVGSGRNKSGRGEACPVLTSSSFDIISSETKWFSDSGVPGSKFPGAKFPRIATLAEIRDTKSGRSFNLINVHLDSKSASLRLKSVNLLLSWVDELPDLPTLIIGDLNCGFEEVETFAALTGAGFSAIDFGANTSPGFDYKNPNDGSQIDHILYSYHWSVKDSKVVSPKHNFSSDHVPVMANLELN